MSPGPHHAHGEDRSAEAPWSDSPRGDRPSDPRAAPAGLPRPAGAPFCPRRARSCPATRDADRACWVSQGRAPARSAGTDVQGWKTARLYLVGGGAVYPVLLAYGLVADMDSDAGFVPLNAADNRLRLLLGLG
ncbi:DUF4383 domain-containing protein [Streptomyces sp. 549]|uniref:DUF4383 domain-containing protein n=1 Tax=Streptomyces sp. 549 TaxID=3049076 RepID=UPI0024C20E67|nr:DUF4383 domain-containing protein [Streptomyces sp. 549]MDK1475832.1 DUF4383 domain-containing protein [Streptomyces sp. 549]